MLHPEAGQTKPWAGSLQEIVLKELDYRRKNLALARKKGWSLEISDIEDYVDEWNAQRMIAGGWLHLVDVDAVAEKKTPSGLIRRLSRNVANAAAKVKTALEIYREMFGTEGKTVPKEEAERRAGICAVCPQNDKSSGLKNYFLKEGFGEITSLIGMLKDMDVRTSLDAELGVCRVCSCPMVVKVHAPGSALKKMPASEVAALHESCWIPDAIASA